MNLGKIPTRRGFLRTRAGTGAAITLRPRVGWAAQNSDPRVAEIAAKTIGIDTHNHIDVPLTASEMPGPNIDLSGELKRSGFSAICATFATDYQPGDAYDRFLKGMASLDLQLTRNGMKRSLTPADIRTAHDNGRPAVIQAIEGAHFLQGHLQRVEEAAHRGVRQFGLLHDSDASAPLGDVYTNPPRFGGLTAFGAEVITQCNRLGILVDLAHASMQTTEGALKVSSRPVVFSHTGLDTQLGSDPRMAEMMRSRLVSKDHAKLIADAGGAIGVWTHLADTPLDYAKNVRALVDVIGVDHVCIGSDTKLTQPSSRNAGVPPGPALGNTDAGGLPARPRPNEFRPGQQHAHEGERTNEVWRKETNGFYYVVIEAMLGAGFTPDEIARIGGGNYLRIFGEAVKV